jgi:hypothetical protein
MTTIASYTINTTTINYRLGSIIMERGIPMPEWLQNKLKNAFREKNKQQICLLNQCWYYYHQRYELVTIRRFKA